MDGTRILWHNMTFICIAKEKDANSGGYFFGDNSLKHSFPAFIFLIALVQIVSNVIYFILKPLRQPKIVCSLLGGVFLGPSFLGTNKTYLTTMFTAREQILIDVTSNIGLIYFLFLTMVKMDSPLTLRRSKRAWIIGIWSIALPSLRNLFLFTVMSNQMPAILKGPDQIMIAAFILTHFPNVVHVLEELDLIGSDVGQMAVTTAAVNDILGWCLLPVGLVIRTGKLYPGLQVATSAALLLMIFFTLRPVLKWVASRTPEGKPVDENHIFGILLGVLFAVFITNSIGLILLGSIMFGLAIPSGPPLATALIDKSELFIMEFLMPLFYLYIGFHTDVYSVRDWKGAFVVLLLSILIAFFKFMGTLLPATMYYNVRVRHGIMLGLLLNVRGVIELIFLRRWKERQLIDQEGYTVMVLVNLTITAISVPLLDIMYKNDDGSNTLPRTDSSTIQKSMHSSELRVVSCIHSEENVHSIITLLEASNPSPISPICTYVAHLVELVGHAAPIVVPYGKHRKLLRSQSSDHIMRAFDNYSGSSKGSVIVRPFTVIAPYKTMHENIRKLATDHNAHLILIPFRKKHDDDVREFAFLRNLNSNIQGKAPCTVGILVDNGFSHQNRFQKFYNVALVFLGGPDDREALAFATRVSGRGGIKISVIRILVSSWKGEHEGQWKLDESVIGEFRMKNTNNPSAVYSEVMAEDGVQVVNVVKSMELNYDLVILGRRPMKTSMFSEEMLSFTENPELGVIGDMIASEDQFSGNHTSILVMQHCSYS